MHPSVQDKRELHTLLGAIRDDCLQPDQEARLQELLRQYPELQDEYVEYLYLCVHLHLNRPMAEKTLIEAIEPIKNPSSDVSVIKAKADRQLNAFLAEERARNPQTVRTRPASRLKIDLRGISRQLMFWGRTAAVAAVWIIGLIFLGLIIGGGYRAWLAKQVVAQVVKTEAVQWEMMIPDSGALLRGEYTLDRGLAHLRFAGGAEVLVQAPCRFKLNSKGKMFLESGRITGHVPPRAKGFIVETPTGRLVDYGTSFGMSLDAERQTEVHVFEGEVGLQSYQQRRSRRRLREGQAVGMDADGEFVKTSYRPARFIREITMEAPFGIPGVRMDLADILGGGNGYGTGSPEIGINMLTGQPTNYLTHYNRYGAPGFHPVYSLAYVDGVFLPDGKEESVIISTAGHVFADCPPTSRGYWTEISNSTIVRADSGARGRHKFALLDGVFYGNRTHPVLLLHANAGITFDLDRIRGDIPGCQINGFKAVCGISDTHPEQGSADVWIIVDGDVRHVEKFIPENHVPVRFDIPLQPGDRFLTLVATDQDMNFQTDVVLIGEPALMLSPN